MKNNIELFDEYVARIFGELYSSFPIPLTLNIFKIAGCEALDEFGEPLSPEGHHPKAFEICKGTIQWLEASGYLHIKSHDRYSANGVVLTAKSLEVLKSTPKSIAVKNSLGEQLVNALNKGVMDIAVDLGKSAVRAGAGLMVEQ